MKLFLTMTAVLSMVLGCGVAVANPTNQEHDLMEHQELAKPLFCVVSYLKQLDDMRNSGQYYPPEAYNEMASRGKGLLLVLISHVESLGHTEAELDGVGTEMYRWIRTEWSHTTWLDAIHYLDCKGMTQQFSTVQPSEKGVWM